MTTYTRRAAAGVCVRCESPEVTHGRRCRTCRDYFNKYARARAKQTTAVGCCIGCGADAADGQSRCAKCRAKNIEKCRAWRKKRH